MLLEVAPTDETAHVDLAAQGVEILVVQADQLLFHRLPRIQRQCHIASLAAILGDFLGGQGAGVLGGGHVENVDQRGEGAVVIQAVADAGIEQSLLHGILFAIALEIQRRETHAVHPVAAFATVAQCQLAKVMTAALHPHHR